MQTGIVAHIKNYVNLTADEATLLQQNIRPVEIKKKQFLLKEGAVCKANYFVERGCVRLFFTDDRGLEQTAQFAIENWWLTDYTSFCTHTPSHFYIQAVEQSTIVAFDQSLLNSLFEKLPQLERYFRLVLEKSYGAAQWRIRYMYSLSKEEMYKHFSTSFPAFVQRVPQYMLASYLGLTPEYLSEIRRKK